MNAQKKRENPNKSNKSTSKTNKKLLKRIFLIFLVVAVAIVALYFILQGVSLYLNGEDADSEESRGQSYIFYDADFDEDIMLDKVYLDLDRNFYYSNTRTGEKLSFDPESLDNIPSAEKGAIETLSKFITYAIEGKYIELNLLFSDEYTENGFKHKMEFTMQKLYDIEIEFIGETSTNEDGVSVTSYDYWLYYKIRRNNGTFRNDMGSDCSRKEYVRVSERDESWEIDILKPFVTSK